MVEVFEKSRFWSKLSEKLDFGRNLQIIAILVGMCENLDFRRNFRKYRFCSEFAKNLDVGRNLPKISILVEFCENLILGRNVRKSRFWSKFCENLNFSRHFATNLGFRRNILNISILSKLSINKFLIISILVVEVFKNRDLVEIIKKKSRFWSNFANNLDLGHILRKSRFWSKCAKSRFCSKFSKISVLV